jgi:hypothetical protein
MFDIVQDSPWMALVPKSISINGIPTTWPGKLEHPIAMIDTGGTQPYLSDPNGDVCQAEWPNPGSMPPWIDGESISCIATKSPIEITVGDATNSWSYTIDLSSLPDVDQTTSLVMCQTCKYMYGANGMNIGGLSMLFNSLMVDYAGYQVGFKPKTAAQV